MGIGGPIKPSRLFSLCNNHARLPRVVAVALIAALLPGCSASKIFSGVPSAVGGETADTPREAANPPAFPAVHDMPAARSVPAMTEEQQKRAEADLVAARDKNIGAPAKPDAQKKVADKKSTEKKQQTAAKRAASTTVSSESQSSDPQ